MSTRELKNNTDCGEGIADATGTMTCCDSRGEIPPLPIDLEKNPVHSNLISSSGQVLEVSAVRTELAIALKTHFAYNLGSTTSWLSRASTAKALGAPETDIGTALGRTCPAAVGAG
jgi:hypothetical protein